MLGFAISDLLLTAGLLWFAKPAISDDEALLGVSAAPTITLAILVALAVGGLTWRFGRFNVVWAPVLAASFLAIPFLPGWRPELSGFICLVLGRR